MKKNSFRFKRNRKAIAALLICVGFVGIHPLAVFAEDDVNVVQTVQQQKHKYRRDFPPYQQRQRNIPYLLPQSLFWE